MYKLIILSILFFAFLKSATEDFSFSLEMTAALVIIIIGGSFLNSPKKCRFLPFIILTLVSASHLIFLFASKDNYSKDIYLVLFSFIFLMALAGINIFFNRHYRQQAKEVKTRFPGIGFNLIKSVIFISIFLWTVGGYGLYLSMEFPTHLLMLIILINIILSTYCLFKISRSLQRETPLLWFYSFLLGIIMVELIWAISFWPISGLTAGAIILANYYIFHNILENYLKNSLNKKIIFSNILFLAIIIASLLFSSQWEIR